MELLPLRTAILWGRAITVGYRAMRRLTLDGGFAETPQNSMFMTLLEAASAHLESLEAEAPDPRNVEQLLIYAHDLFRWYPRDAGVLGGRTGGALYIAESCVSAESEQQALEGLMDTCQARLNEIDTTIKGMTNGRAD